ncbi:NYN domain-containing protein [Variovorax sp. Sphag1AA]|uniref:NYN domain-containing protein n=1 Tax=Variovorax sp. Sphag1AA TaxID=2587027 RepID=UPI00161E8CB0|nr:NYN domain-containing protein [Variovorax sp. Sphag1AA]MBB3175889.1 hypothetical protein [Variovorax sp. Sphag1AA]
MDQFPLPALGRMMVFIDGENLVMRYEEMLSKGRTPTHEVKHQKEVFAWSHAAVWPSAHVVQRATYYTYFSGSDPDYAATERAIRSLTFGQYAAPGQSFTLRLNNNLYPRVFRKVRGQRAGKGVDIQLTIDCLGHAYNDNLDTVYLIAGDGDYEPLITECQRYGKTVMVAALSSGLNDRLPRVADQFIDLDGRFFDPVP